ncbi:MULTISPECIES: pilus assembly protein PilP [unclassified Acinetobacter]|uniref:pilus assembly protein PilP n=1 Tax=unclassified Acinetobacter TaxID=196816 RepID=UPI0035B92ADE
MSNLKISSNVLVLVAALSLVGCVGESRVEKATAEMETIRNQPALPVPPPPVFPPIPSYAYGAFAMKSPFISTSLANEMRVMAGRRVYPNPNRIKQPLESYPLEDLIMKGTMYRPGVGIVALILSKDGEITPVQRGNYLGENSGRVVNITTNQISIVEIVPDGQDGYVERPRTMVLRDAAVK